MATWLILAATFSGAFLLFLIQPLMAKYLLPYFGGTSSVWTVSLFFYSTVLLLGYLYAAIITRLKLPLAGLMHGVFLISVLALFAYRLQGGVPPILMEPVANSAPAVGVLLTLLIAVGLPVLLLASTSILTQVLYARVTNANPYPLYALSNLGSLTALLAYPFLIEPFSFISVQSAWWVMGFVVFTCVLLLGWFWADTKDTAPVTVTLSNQPSSFPLITVLLLAAVPTVLLTAVTEQVTRAIASFPLLWVMPLALYLTSFIVAFRGRERKITVPVIVIALLTALVTTTWLSGNWWQYGIGVSLLMTAFFVVSTYLHRTLYELRPHVAALGSFYVWVTAGGALGSGLVALVLPFVFNDYYELMVVLVGLLLWFVHEFIKTYKPHLNALFRPAAISIGVLLIGGIVLSHTSAWQSSVASERNFYGTIKVIDTERVVNDELVPVRAFINGGTVHGQEVLTESLQSVPTSYYGEGSGVAVAIDTLQNVGITPRVAVVGLGVGMMNLYCDEVAVIDYIEVNPAVEQLAREYFSYLDTCSEKTSVTIADGRQYLFSKALSGERATYDIIMIDAFTDDAIPTHLLTFEALASAYAPLLSEQGIVVVHTSNRYLNLLPAIAGMAEPAGYQVVRYEHTPSDTLSVPTSWVFVTAPKYTARLQERATGAGVYTGAVPMEYWTDEQSSVLPLLFR